MRINVLRKSDLPGGSETEQAIYITLNERTDGGAYCTFKESMNATEVAEKLRELASTVEEAARG